MPIDRANLGSAQREAKTERLLAQHHSDLQRIMRRLGETVEPGQPAQLPGDQADSGAIPRVGVATLNGALSAGSTATATLGTETITVEDNILSAGNEADSGATILVWQSAPGENWELVNIKCTSIS